MGCCKGSSRGNRELPNLLDKETGELNSKGKLLKIPVALFYTTLLVILSPFLLIFIWYMIMLSAFDSNSNVIDLLLRNFQKKQNDKPEGDLPEEDLSEFNEDDYEVINVDIIK